VRFKKHLWFLLAAAAPSMCSAATTGSHRLEPDDRSAPDKELARVIRIEKDFAAASLSQGIKQSFLAYAAPDAVLFRPSPVAAVAALMNDPDDNDGLTLDWWPAMGAIAGSGDMALSVGPWVLDVPGATRQRLYGYYATIWKKQPDGSWKFVIDGAGAKIASEPAREKGGAVAKLPVSKARRPVALCSTSPCAACRSNSSRAGLMTSAASSTIIPTTAPRATRSPWRSAGRM